MLQHKTLTPDQMAQILNAKDEAYRVEQKQNAVGTMMIGVSVLMDAGTLHRWCGELFGVMPNGELRLWTVNIDLANRALNDLLGTDTEYFWQDTITPMSEDEIRQWDGE